ncbi:MAG: cobalt transporter CbiM [Methanobacteriaceae archaeon]
MHIPDGIFPIPELAMPQLIVYFIIVIIVGYFAIKWARENLDERKMPLLAVLAAGIFAVQMLNVPIGVASGHLLGAALVAILLGSPFAGFLVLAIVLIIQALFFGDGGLTTLGLNMLNMGVIASGVGFYGFKFLKPIVKEVPAIFIASFASVLVAAIACTIELWLGGTIPLKEGLVLMGTSHLIIGLLIEGTLTAVVYTTIKKIRPDLIANV